ncbi:MAG: TonB-dependent receptor domain-containing protein [Candidatus Sulfotelmatobacter sp.]
MNPRIHTRPFGRYSVLLCFTVALLTASPQAQNSQGTILGHVQDSSGAALPGVRITATNVNTNVTNHFTTNGTGDYVLVDLIPGTYQVRVEADGFKSEVSGNLILEVDQTLRQNFTLQVGQIKEVMTVTADAQMVQTDNTTVGNVLDQKMIEELPSSGRDFNNLLGLVAGAGNVSGGSQVYWANHGLNSSFTEVSLNGERPESVSFMIDGVADTDNFFTSASGIPSEFSIQEFKVQTGLYSAEYGQGSGQINVAIKSGTNQWHGQAYDYVQNDMFNPKSPLEEYEHIFEGGAVPKVAPFKQNQFGGTLGGPLRIPGLYNGHDKTFWFFAYDGGRQHTVPVQQPIQVPTAQERTGNFSDWPYPLYDPTTGCNPTCDATTRTAYTGNQITSTEINAMGQKLANLFPLPNINCTMPCNNYLAPILNTITTNNETFRVDQNLGSKDRFYFTGNVRSDTEPHPSMVPYTGSKNFTKAQLFALNWERTINSTTINTARIGYNHLFFATNGITAFGPNLQANLGFANAPATPALYGLPVIGFAQGYNGIGNGNNGTNTKSGTYQFVDNLKMIRGKHSITVGFDIRRLREFEEDNYLGTGTISFNGEYTANCNRGAAGCNLGSSPGPGLGNSAADMLLSDPTGLSGPYPLGVDYLHTFGTNWNFFAQDDIRVTPRLTMNLGLRYELPPAFHSINDSGWGFDPANGGSLDWVNKSFVQGIYQLAASQNPPVNVNPAFLNCCIQNSLVSQDKKDFAPRIGLSWRPLATDRFVVRAGYGIFYETYMRYYDQVQNYDDNSLQTLLPASYPTGNEVGNEQQSLGPRLNQLWSAPIQGLGGEGGQGGVFTLPSWDSVDFVGIDYILNQVDWPHNHNPYSQQWTLDTQFAVTPTLLLDVGYVGSHGLRLSTYLLYNTANPAKVTSDACNYLFDASQATGSNASCATDPNFQPIDTRVPYPGLPSMMYANANVLGSNYNSLQVQLRQRFNHGLTYNVAYTWSKSLDDFSGYNVSGNGGFIQDAHNIAGDYGPSSFNQPNRLTFNGSWELPVGKGKRWSLGPANWALGGWKASGIYTITSGRTFTAYGCTVCGFDEMGVAFPSRYRPNQSANPNSGFTRSYIEWFNPNVFSLAPQGTYGDEGKGELRGPYYEDLDLSFAKEFLITERQHMQVRFEMFNAGSNWHRGAWFPCASVPSCGNTPLGSLVPPQPAANVSDSQWAHDNLWQGHTIQLSAVYSF